MPSLRFQSTSTSALLVNISHNTAVTSFETAGTELGGLTAQGCQQLSHIHGQIAVLDISESGVLLNNVNCTISGSEILLARELHTKPMADGMLDIIKTCYWTARRKLMDIAGSWSGPMPRAGAEAALNLSMRLLPDGQSGPVLYPLFTRSLNFGEKSTVQCDQQSRLITFDMMDPRPPPQLVMEYKCKCAAAHDYHAKSDQCVRRKDFLATQAGVTTVVMSTLLATALLLLSAYAARRRILGLKGNLDLTERLLGAAEDDVLAMRRAWEIDSADVKLKGRIDGASPGAFGEVWLGDWDNIAVAVKVLRLSLLELDPSMQEEFDKEAEFLMRSRHSNLVRFFGAGVQDGGAPFLVLELVSRGSLRGLLRGSDARNGNEVHPLLPLRQLSLTGGGRGSRHGFYSHSSGAASRPQIGERFGHGDMAR